MRKYIKSLRLFTANCTIKNMLYMLLAIVLIAALGFVVMLLEFQNSPDDFIQGFFTGFMPTIMLVLPVVGLFLLNSVYSCALPSNHGYKYFKSVCGGAAEFKRAIISANVMALIIAGVGVAACAAVNCYYQLMSFTVPSAFAFLALALVNFVGYARNIYARLFTIMPIFIISGFINGFSAGSAADGEDVASFLNTPVMYVILAVSALAYVGSLIYSQLVCEKKWGRD